MAAYFVTVNGRTHIISNTMSILNAGFRAGRAYYNKSGDTLRYFKDDAGHVIARISRRRHQPVISFFDDADAANKDFVRMNSGKTFNTGKWVPEKSS